MAAATDESPNTLLEQSQTCVGKDTDDKNLLCDENENRKKSTHHDTHTSCEGHGSELKLLPCLHVQCVSCIDGDVDLAKCPAVPNGTLYSCKVCGNKINNTTSSKISDTLKNVPSFLCNHSDGLVTSDGTCTSVDYLYPENNTIQRDDGHKSVDSSSATSGDSIPDVPADFSSKSKSDYLSNLIAELQIKTQKHEQSVSCIGRVKNYLTVIKKEIEEEILERSQYLISLIKERQSSLMQELDDTLQTHLHGYEKMKNKLLDELDQFRFVDSFTTKLLNNGSPEEILYHHDDASNACLRQLHQIQDANVDVVSLKLDIPGKGKEQSSLEKLFGSLTEGTVLSGAADLVASFNVDMKWPTGIAVSQSKEIVITGKSGTFETPGKAFFFDSRGRFHSKVNFDAEHVPLDVRPAGDGTVWMSNNNGEMLNMSSAGRVLRTVPDVFQGSGQISVLSDGSLAVASSFEKKIHLLDEIGLLKKSISMPDDFGDTMECCTGQKNGVKLNAMTTNSTDNLIVGDSDGGRIIVMDTDGNLKLTYPNDIRQQEDASAPVLKCPSTVCCDPFDNILVADFTNDSVHLFSKSGQFLGDLLTKTNGISCPNCMALDHEGKLYIGQYGGDILVYRYMSCSKRI